MASPSVQITLVFLTHVPMGVFAKQQEIPLRVYVHWDSMDPPAVRLVNQYYLLSIDNMSSILSRCSVPCYLSLLAVNACVGAYLAQHSQTTKT